MADKYTALLGKLKEATGPFDLQESLDIARKMYGGGAKAAALCRALAGGQISIGAALALVDLELPGNTWKLGSGSKSRKAPPPWFSIDAPTYHEASAPTLPLAILTAWCEAMIQQEQSE